MRVLIFILSYNAERHIEAVFADIPPGYLNCSSTEILLIDDASQDRTVEMARACVARMGLKNVRVVKNGMNQGYGGNQKVGYTYAIREGFDVVVMLHGDNQYTPRVLPELLRPFEADPDVACVLGVRFGQRYSPLRGGMPIYKYVGNRILTGLQNRLAGVRFSEWHTGYRAYSTKALARIGFALNTNDFHFDTEILLQLIKSEAKVVEVNIPTRYGDEICRVNGMRYAKDVIKTTFRFMLQKYHLFYDARFQPEIIFGDQVDGVVESVYERKAGLRTPHVVVCRDDRLLFRGANVLDIGCSKGQFAEVLVRTRQCRVTGIDSFEPASVSSRLARYEQIDLETEEHRVADLVAESNFDVIFMLDVIERLSMPERLLLR